MPNSGQRTPNLTAILALMDECGLTPTNLAEGGIHNITIAKLLNGEPKQFRVFKKLAEMFTKSLAKTRKPRDITPGMLMQLDELAEQPRPASEFSATPVSMQEAPPSVQRGELRTRIRLETFADSDDFHAVMLRLTSGSPSGTWIELDVKAYKCVRYYGMANDLGVCHIVGGLLRGALQRMGIYEVLLFTDVDVVRVIEDDVRQSAPLQFKQPGEPEVNVNGGYRIWREDEIITISELSPDDLIDDEPYNWRLSSTLSPEDIRTAESLFLHSESTTPPELPAPKATGDILKTKGIELLESTPAGIGTMNLSDEMQATLAAAYETGEEIRRQSTQLSAKNPPASMAAYMPANAITLLQAIIYAAQTDPRQIPDDVRNLLALAYEIEQASRPVEERRQVIAKAFEELQRALSARADKPSPADFNQ